jgi:hypothetical protein
VVAEARFEAGSPWLSSKNQDFDYSRHQRRRVLVTIRKAMSKFNQNFLHYNKYCYCMYVQYNDKDLIFSMIESLTVS